MCQKDSKRMSPFKRMALFCGLAVLKLGLAGLVLGAVGLLGGCAALPEAPQRPAVYDLGPAPAAAATAATGTQRSLMLAPIEANAALDGVAMVYRMSHTQALELKPYALARWSAAPPALVRDRATQALAHGHTVLGSSDPAAGNAWLLKLELLRFEQVFASDTASTAQFALRATLFGPDGQPRAQRSFANQADAGGNAASGAAALRQATDAALTELVAWVGMHAK
jgi:cholesterol transport system auxiliary component